MLGRLRTHPLLEVTGLFLKLGGISSGGTAAPSALMEQELQWRFGQAYQPGLRLPPAHL